MTKTPEQKIKFLILARGAEMEEEDHLAYEEMSGEEINAAYDALVEADMHWDSVEEVRGGFDAETNLPCDWSRHYESKAVASQMPDGSWVGWTYWYGGGKHGEPGAIDWMNEAYDLDVSEEETVVTVRTFSIPQPSSTPNT